MKVLIIVAKDPAQRFLVKLHTEKLIREISKLINKGKHSQAMVSALSKGRFESEVAYYEVPNVSADLILTEDSAMWDLTNK